MFCCRRLRVVFVSTEDDNPMPEKWLQAKPRAAIRVGQDFQASVPTAVDAAAEGVLTATAPPGSGAGPLLSVHVVTGYPSM